MNKGWVKLHRKFLEWEWYTDNNTKVVFLHCLLKANHKKKRWRGEEIERGSFITSLSNLASETGLSVQNVRTALDKLEKTGEINKESTSVNTTITITYYDRYQSTNKEVTKNQQGINKEVTTTKNEKNVKNDNIKPYTSDFEKFWELYDLKKGKKKAWIEWEKLSEDDKQTIFENVPIFLTHFSSKQYTPRPRKYLYNRYWEDEDYQKPQQESNHKTNGQQSESRTDRFIRRGNELYQDLPE